jgi:hypothetical protein
MGAPQPGTGHRSDADQVALPGRRTCGYGAQMRRSLPKLAVRRETIRALATLELARVVGGNTAQTITCIVNCTTDLVKLPAD